MLKKLDLIKKFELTTQQEIINHNRAIELSNNRLNVVESNLSEISGDFESIESELLNIKSSIESSASSVYANFQNELALISSRFSKIEEKINKSDVEKKVVLNDIFNIVKMNAEFLHNHTIYRQENDKKISSQGEKIASLEFELGRVKRDCFQYFEKLLKDHESLPSEAQEVKKELLEKIAIQKVDNEGILREIKFLKKVNDIQDKYIEHIYILLNIENKHIEDIYILSKNIEEKFEAVKH